MSAGVFTSVDAWIAAGGVPTAEPDWGGLQDAYRTLRAYGYAMTRRRCGGILVDGHRMAATQVRQLAAKLQAGQVRWQGNGRAA